MPDFSIRELPKLIAATAVGIAVCDGLAFAHRFFGQIGAGVWLLSYAFLFRYAIARFAEAMRQEIRGKGGPILFVTVLFVAGVLGCAFLTRNAHIESFIETGCALQQFFARDDAGFHGVCHYGYPTRSYSLAMVPTLLFGPSISALNLGMGLYGVLGLLFFSSGLVTSMGRRQIAGWIGALALCLLPQVRTVLITFLCYEQSGFPVAWSLVLCGLLAHFERRRGLEELALLGLVGMHLAYSYTPVLPLLVAELAILLWLLRPGALTLPMRRWVYGAIALVSLSFLMSLAQRADIRIFQPVFGHKEVGAGLTGDVLKHLLFQSQGMPFATGWSHVVAILYVAAAFTGLLGGWHFAVALWGMATIVVGASVAGVTRGDAAYGMYRMLAVVPVFAWAWARLVDERLPAKRWAKGAVVAGVIALLAWNVHQAVTVVSVKTELERVALYRKISALVPADFKERGYVLILLSDRDPKLNFSTFGDVFYYFGGRSVGMERGIYHCRLPLPENPRQLRVAYRGFQCSVPGDSEVLGTITHDDVELVVERLR